MTITVSEYIVEILNRLKINSVFGVISIHNLPIADAIGRHDKMFFIPARGEAGSTAMADSYARIHGLGVSLTSTGAGAGNAVGALLEALNAGSPLLHITGEVETPYLDRITGFIHETKDQQGFLAASCKVALRVNSAEEIETILAEAVKIATTAPKGPVSITIPIDLQLSRFTPTHMSEQWLCSLDLKAANQLIDETKINLAAQKVVDKLKLAKVPILWVGGGAKHCVAEISTLADKGIAVISSTHGRGILSDNHPRSLKAHHNHPAVIDFLASAELVMIIGSKLRSNETASFTIQLGQSRMQIDLDPMAVHRSYKIDELYEFDTKELLARVIKLLNLENHSWVDEVIDNQIKQIVKQADKDLSESVGNYAQLSEFIEHALGEEGIFVRDITISGSTWGSRLLKRVRPITNIHSLAGAIGLGLPHAIGVAIASPEVPVVAVVGDGGIMLNIGELGTMIQEHLNLCLIIMNDGGYGVMRGIQAKYFDNRQFYNELATPNFCEIAQAHGIESYQVNTKADLNAILVHIKSNKKPVIIEIMMQTFGELKFAGPPQKKLY